MPSFLLTGPSGIGKTTIILKVTDALRMRKFEVGGMVSREVRVEGKRVGFELLDLASGRRGWLAHVELEVGPRIGKYRVNTHDLENIGVNSLLKAVDHSDAVVCDEIGPMELTSAGFRRAVETIVNSSTPVLGTLHHRYASTLIPELESAPQLEVHRVTMSNREAMPFFLLRKIASSLPKKPNSRK